MVRCTAFALLLVVIVALAGCRGAAEPAPEKSAKRPAEEPAGKSAKVPEPATKSPLLDPKSSEMAARAPDVFRAKFETSKGDFVIETHRDWAPHGADRFYNLVRNGYYDGVRFFRVLDGFVAQFGMHGDPKLGFWNDETIPADPVRQSNLRGMVTYAMGASPSTRSVQLFINYGDNSRLDANGFAPFGTVLGNGMTVVSKLYAGYGEGPPRGRGPDQARITEDGNAYLNRQFPKLDSVTRATIVK